MPPDQALALDRNEWQRRLEQRFKEVDAIILSRQDPITGLLPASTAKTAHGDYTDAWVRDNVYSILAVWGLALAYRRLDDSNHRTYLLSHSVIKLMRGLLIAMMRQADKVERFKHTLNPKDALHAKYDTRNCTAVVGDEEWGHLQLDSTSLYLLMLAQITASGLHVIYNLDEVNFIQNLVHYISRAYCTPDFGIWERGNKINHGITELNASSVGMAKAALEALSGFDLFSAQGYQSSIIHVDPNDIAHARVTLEALLPRESGSKEVDAAGLSIIGFPAFAVEDKELVEHTQQQILDKLQGRYGCKRFLLDGHQTVLEDPERLHYEPSELKQFEHIECEWPLFFTYAWLNALFQNDQEQARSFQFALESLLVERHGQQLLPELYFIPAEYIDQEKAIPHSQRRQPNENIPLVWAQSLYMLAGLLQEGLLYTSDIDPLRRRQCIGRVRSRRVQIAVLAQNETVQAHLESQGIVAETLADVKPLQVRRAEELAFAYTQVGRNQKLGLSGRPLRPPGSLETSRVHELSGERMVFIPQFLDTRDFYLSLDNRLLVEQFRNELTYIERHWDQPGKPLLVMVITDNMLQEKDHHILLALMEELQSGTCNGVPIQSGRLAQLLPTTTRERIDYVHNFRFSTTSSLDQTPTRQYLSYNPRAYRPLNFRQVAEYEQMTNPRWLIERLTKSDNPFEQIELIRILSVHETLDFDTQLGHADDEPITLRALAEEVYWRASESHQWAVLRRLSDLLGKFDTHLEVAVTDIVIRQKRLAVGRAYSDEAIITKPMENNLILEKIRSFCGTNEAEATLTQEIVLYLGQLIKTQPEWFKDMLTLRVWHLILLIASQISRNEKLTPSDAYERLLSLSPHRILEYLREVLTAYPAVVNNLFHTEALHSIGDSKRLSIVEFPKTLTKPGDEASNWRQWRIQMGLISRLSDEFYAGIWELLQHCDGIVIGDKFNRYNRIDSELTLGQSTREEQNFALHIDHLLNRIIAPEYRQLSIEALQMLIVIIKNNPTLKIHDDVVLDVVIGHAVRLNWEKETQETTTRYNDYRSQAWDRFYYRPPHRVASALLKALKFLLESGASSTRDNRGPSDFVSELEV